ncbi:acyl-CoA-binding domain-containing protein 5 isoform X2 [Eublepharis macularius]|uniref:Acyl-CoA-binding domain-containing protein 5 isoform X2 n=1 Tax=Eublepharis macularius TaxID=481883 RepID=A0AA97K110_EUBMA|nr:acyl-CoA-binding domain-containing protein 5 isoform X2 [Eublepharis macularius]
MAETESSGSVHETRFEAAVKVIQSLPKNGSFQPTNEMMLKFYSFYKQATQGPCNIPRPGFWDPIGRYKWDAWNALGDMPKEDAMIAYVEEMKKILETMPMTEKVEELLHVLGPFYEIVEDKKNRGSGIISGPGTAVTSVPAVNGKSESSDSGAESEEEVVQEETEELKETVEESKTMEEESAVVKELDSGVTNGGYDDDIPNSDLANGIQTKSALNGINEDEEIKKKDKCLELPIRPLFGSYHQGVTEDTAEEVSGIQHLTSDSDSEVYCDSMEQFGQEELLEIRTPNKEPSEHHFHFSEVDRGSLLETAGFLEPGNCKSEGHRMHPVGDGSQGGHMGSGGDGERWGSDRGPRSSLSEQIAVVLIRLQEDMQNVFQRLNTLETLTASQTRNETLHSNKQSASPVKRPSWWPFEISPGTLAFAILWPFIAQWLVHTYRQRRRRKEI